MVDKSTPSPSHKITAEEHEHARSHPLRQGRSIADSMIERAGLNQQREEVIIERIEDWKKAVNRLASSPDGKLFFGYLIKSCNLHTPQPNARDTVQAVVDKQRQDFYLRHVRPYLDKSIRAEIE